MHPILAPSDHASASRAPWAVTDYKVQATEGNPEGKGAIAVFMHHNKAGGTGVKVALQQMYDANGTAPGLSHVNVFSSSACAYSASAVARNRASVRSALCDAPLWSELKIPSCGRCHAPALASLREHKPMLYVLLAGYAVVFLLAAGLVPPLSDSLRLVAPPSS